jgi:hypothetical protein
VPTCPGEHHLRSLSLGALFQRDSAAPSSRTQRREHATILAASYLATTPEIGAPVLFAVPHDDIDDVLVFDSPTTIAFAARRGRDIFRVEIDTAASAR